MEMGMYCKVCMEKDEEDDGFQYFDMELVNVEEHDAERSIHTYEGKCPKCGTVHQYISYRKEVDYDFIKKVSE